MDNNIFRTNVSISRVCKNHDRQFAFGVTHEPQPREIFFPCWIVRAFDMTVADEGEVFNVLFIDRPEDKNPCVLAIIDDDVLLQAAEKVGTAYGRPGTTEFSATVTSLNNGSLV